MATQAPFPEPQNLWSKPSQTLAHEALHLCPPPTLSSAGSPDHLPLSDLLPSRLFPLQHVSRAAWVSYDALALPGGHRQATCSHKLTHIGDRGVCCHVTCVLVYICTCVYITCICVYLLVCVPVLCLCQFLVLLYVYLYLCFVCICICIYRSVCVFWCVCVCVCAYACVCMDVYVCACICMYVHVSICVSVWTRGLRRRLWVEFGPESCLVWPSQYFQHLEPTFKIRIFHIKIQLSSFS